MKMAPWFRDHVTNLLSEQMDTDKPKLSYQRFVIVYNDENETFSKVIGKGKLSTSYQVDVISLATNFPSTFQIHQLRLETLNNEQGNCIVA